MPRTQVFEIELEVPDDAPEFEKRLQFQKATATDWVIAAQRVLTLQKVKNWIGLECHVAIPKKAWRPATREDVAAQILGTKDFEWRFYDEDQDYCLGRKCVGYNNDPDTLYPFWCEEGYSWNCAEVLA